ncbi:DUF2057 family protein [uncultured Marinobacter sp.]|uniref:DUF2057 family protein n=1 Tax=uncultured Marinobacter sp. TaxID=187379 RepID=UPI0025FEF82C|nr:DUF2057 family protein [uncultured Marinobacter sp.]
MSLVGCASSVSVVETWEGDPAAASNAATLQTPGEIRVTRVNGRVMTNFLMDDLALDYALLPGENEVVFVYKTIWAKSGVVRNGESKVHVIESEPQVVRFEAEAGETYGFEFDKPESRQEAEQEMPEFSAEIVSSAGIAVASSAVWDPSEQMTASRTPIPASSPESSAATGDNALEQLKTIWETASDEEKKAFLRWAFE